MRWFWSRVLDKGGQDYDKDLRIQTPKKKQEWKNNEKLNPKYKWDTAKRNTLWDKIKEESSDRKFWVLNVSKTYEEGKFETGNTHKIEFCIKPLLDFLLLFSERTMWWTYACVIFDCRSFVMYVVSYLPTVDGRQTRLFRYNLQFLSFNPLYFKLCSFCFSFIMFSLF